MKPEIGKCYMQTATGVGYKVIGELKTTKYGKCYIAESNNSDKLVTFGNENTDLVGFEEMSETDYLLGFGGGILVVE